MRTTRASQVAVVAAALGTAATLALSAPAAHAAPEHRTTGTTSNASTSGTTLSLYAPSALVLTVTDGDGTDPAATVLRAVTLNCTPTPSGTHPAPSAACAGLAAADGQFAQLTGSDRFCTRIYQPVTLTADGVWRGKHVAYRETFGNACVAVGAKGPVFDF